MPDSEACPEPAGFYVEWQDADIRFAHLTGYASLACERHTAQLRAGIPLTEYDGRPEVTLVRDLASHDRLVHALQGAQAASAGS